MLLVELRFFLFFAVVFVVHWSLRNNTAKKVWLLLASYYFYASWDYRFLPLIFCSSLIDYIGGLRIAAARTQAVRRAWLVTCMTLNLGFLAFFKYFNFFIESATGALRALGVEARQEHLAIILPVGISFYTFQSMSYTIDIYRRQMEPRRSLLDFSLFVTLFPHLTAGPIVRARSFLPQFDAAPRWDAVDVRANLVITLIGFVKKACISDNVAPLVDRYFANPGAYSAFASWIAVPSYAVQIYCDFSGYSDMAIGTAGLLGYTLCRNFDAPYLSSNITEFWRRWHISLSTWLRDYLYIPLGGNRGSRLFGYRNLMLTMVLGGLWHGASWNFVIWGAMHGVALVAHKVWQGLRSSSTLPFRGLLGGALTLWWVLLTWIFFRSADLPMAGRILRAFVFFDAPGNQELPVAALVVVACLGLFEWTARRTELSRRWQETSTGRFTVSYAVAWSLAIAFVPTAYRPFIYFQF